MSTLESVVLPLEQSQSLAAVGEAVKAERDADRLADARQKEAEHGNQG